MVRNTVQIYNLLLLEDIISVLILLAHKQALQTEVIRAEVIPWLPLYEASGYGQPSFNS